MATDVAPLSTTARDGTDLDQDQAVEALASSNDRVADARSTPGGSPLQVPDTPGSDAPDVPPPSDGGGHVAPGLIGRLVPPFLAIISTWLGWALVGEMTTEPRMWWASAVMLVTMALRLVLELVATRSGAGSTTMLMIYGVHVALVAASVGLNPLASIYAFVGYLDADRYLDGRRLYVLVLVTATLCAVGQAGGYHVIVAAPFLFVGLAAVNLFMASAMIYLSIVREREMAERERTLAALEQAHRENSELQEELLARARERGINQERGRLSREIHDTVAQGLVGVIRQLEAVGGELEAEGPAREDPVPAGGRDRRALSVAVHGADPTALGDGKGGEARRRVAIAEEAARECLVEARRAVEALAPQQLTDAGTAHGLGELVARWARAHRIVATFDADDAPCHGAHAAVLIRIAQEALANVSRHSGAQTVTVTLSGSEDEQSLQITDDGRGFDAETVTRGHGLGNMAQRVEEVGGRLHVSSHGGAGTTVIATVPR